MLGQPIPMLIPQVIGFKMTGAMKPGCTATDLVLTVTEMLRKKGVVDKFVEFFGDGLANLPLADRATIANMAPEYGSTCGIFPIDEETLRYLELSGRPPEQIALVEAYAKAQGMWRINGAKPADYTDVLELDLATVEPSLAGPKRPQDRVPLSKAKTVYQASLKVMADERKKKLPDATGCAEILLDGKKEEYPRWRGHHRRDHELHQHLESLRAHGRRPAGAQRRQARAQVQALGQDQPRSRLARGHRLPHQGRVVSAARIHRLQRRRLRLHHLHRQLRPAEARDLRRHQGGRHRRHVGVVGQPQFRRPRSSRNQDELPRLAAARRRVCARRHHGRRSADRSARHTVPTANPCCSPTSGPRTRKSPTRCTPRSTSAHVPQELRQRVRGRCQLAGHQDSRRARSTSGRKSPPTCAIRPTSKA